VDINWPDTPSLGEELDAFRHTMRDWIAANRPPELDILREWNPYMGERPTEVPAQARPAYAEWSRRLREAGLLCPEWPSEYGGSGFTPLQAAILSEEMETAGAPVVTRGPGELLVGPAILAHGTPEQKERFIPPIIAGEERYCQGLSEPDAGSDLAGVRCRGEIDGGQIRITGQKVWTSEAADATHLIVLCRTDPSAPKHRGLSLVVVEIDKRYVTMRPLRQMPGGSEFCEVFLENAPAPEFNIIGGAGNGWRVVQTALSYERGGAATVHHLRFRKEVAALADLINQRGRMDDPAVRRQLAWAYAQVEIMRYQGLRLMNEIEQGIGSGASASVRKLFWSEYHQQFCESALKLIGSDAAAAEAGSQAQARAWRELYLWSRAETIYAGTSEIQRNIIGERILGLPKEPAPPATGGQRA
jgi:alkylation response protein AidB-like acyl-CoA dehydrogenase